MDKSSLSLLLLLAVTNSGCAISDKLAFQNPIKVKQTAPTADTRNTSTFLGSPDFSSASKLRDPVKTRLAYAIWCEQAGNLQEAHSGYKKVLEKSPKNPEAMIGMARVERTIGRESEADARLQKALKLHPKDPKVLVAVGQVHADRKEWPEALEKMKAAYEIDPFDKVYEYHLAVIEARTGDLSSAMNHFTQSVGQAEAFYNIGYILKEQGRTTEAEKYLMNAIRMKPDLKQAETTLASIHSGHSLREVLPASFDEQ